MYSTFIKIYLIFCSKHLIKWYIDVSSKEKPGCKCWCSYDEQDENSDDENNDDDNNDDENNDDENNDDENNDDENNDDENNVEIDRIFACKSVQATSFNCKGSKLVRPVEYCSLYFDFICQ